MSKDGAVVGALAGAAALGIFSLGTGNLGSYEGMQRLLARSGLAGVGTTKVAASVGGPWVHWCRLWARFSERFSSLPVSLSTLITIVAPGAAIVGGKFLTFRF